MSSCRHPVHRVLERSQSCRRPDSTNSGHSRASGKAGAVHVAEGESRPLRADLMVKDLNVLVEAKATDARYAIRMAIGQLHDYRRFEPTAPELAVLVPKEPIRDLRRLLDGLTIGCVWPRGDGYRDSVDGRLCA
jgi:hypothetical protein